MRLLYTRAVKPGHWRTGCGGYFGSDGSRHIKNVEPLPDVTTRKCTQR
jgi:hypothetical protein